MNRKRRPQKPGIKLTTPVLSSAPSTKWELLQQLHRLLSLTPAAPFSRLLSAHRRCPELQSVESYNLLLLLSIRHGFSLRTRHLIDSMAMRQIEPNETTEKLMIRYLVSSGHWERAWQQVMIRHSLIANIPLSVLLELLAPNTRHYSRPKRIPVHRVLHPRIRPPSQQPPQRSPDPSVNDDRLSKLKLPLDTLLLVLNRFSTLPLHGISRLPPRVISYIVRGLIHTHQQQSALILTANHIKSLPPVLKREQVDFARDLIHLQLTWGGLKLSNYRKRRRLVEDLFNLHPSLHPNAKTVFLLMRYMEKSKRCGIEAYLFFKNYRARWGAIVDDLDVRRRIVQYALKQRKHGITKEISKLPPLEEPTPIRPSHGMVNTLLPIRAWRAMYPREGKKKRYWKRVFFRLLGRRRVWYRKKITSI
ncbi:hypothetical protein K439DRAFT_840284 [Ramaria rubella]|nr:hypothetical protein K439DRAFT_840284 [Ramaria rubella]